MELYIIILVCLLIIGLIIGGIFIFTHKETYNKKYIINVEFKRYNGWGKLYEYYHFIRNALLPFYDIYKKYNGQIKTIIIDEDMGEFKYIFEKIYNINVIYNRIFNKNIPLEICDSSKNIYKHENSVKFIKNKLHIPKSNPNYIVLIERGIGKDSCGKKCKSYLKKNGKHRRSIVNHNELKNALKYKYGSKLKNVILENLSFYEQVKLFNKAKVIIGQHGAGFINMYWCPKKTKIIEIAPDKGSDNIMLFKKFCNILNLKHSYTNFDKNLSKDRDVIVNVNEVLQQLT